MLKRLAGRAHSLLQIESLQLLQSSRTACSLQPQRTYKGSTGLVGLDVDPEARSTFTDKCRAVIDLVGQHIPAEAAYRRNVENTYRHRLKTSESSMTNEEVEEAFSAQLEQLSKMADEEL